MKAASQNVSPSTSQKSFHLFLLLSGVGVLAWSAIKPYDYPTWIAEVAPAVIGGALFVVFYNRFRFSSVSYLLSWFFALILIVGGHYTYSRVPVGNWFQNTFEMSRNHYDRFGHFFQGVVPAMLGRELLLRTSPLRRGKWLFVICTSAALAISAMYELIEWAAAVTSGAEDFLATQGDIWDAQSDMFLAMLGGMIAQIIFSRLQDRQIARIQLDQQA